MKVNSKQAASMLVSYLKAKLVPMMVSSPGIGKSSIIHQIAKEYQLKIIDLRLSQCDPTDLCGFPVVENGKAGYVPMNTFPIEGDLIPEGYTGWLLFLDEFNGASAAVQMASYKLVLDRMVGLYKLHKNVIIMCAGNLDTDNAIVNPISTAMQSRMVHLELVVDHKTWLDWAIDNGINHFIIDYIKFKPSSLYTFKPDHSDQTYASPRTWEFLSRLLVITDINDTNITPLVAGVISEGIAREFLTFTKIYDKLPSIASIENIPESTVVPVDPSHLYALTGCISHNTTVKNISQLMKYINRLPIEFQVITLREILRKNVSLAQHEAILKWQSTNMNKFF